MTLRVGRAQFHQRSMYSFYARRSQKRKKDSQVVNLFYAFGIYERKSCTKNVDEIVPIKGYIDGEIGLIDLPGFVNLAEVSLKINEFKLQRMGSTLEI